ncbi:MAG: glycosyltransferase family 39 protein [Nannocystaceae bacterium]
MSAGRMRRVGAWLFEQRWPVAILLASLVVRVHWNLRVHPPADYVYSDMNGYVSRAAGLFTDLWGKREYAGFYPWGTHALMYAFERALGRGNLTGVGVAFAVMGALSSMFGYLIARRVSRFRWVAPAVGLWLVFDYPMISLSGYFLSETPFALGMLAATWLLLRVVDHGRARDAVLAGVGLAFATVMRPQILVSVALLGPLWFFGRRLWPRLTLPRLLQAAAPLVLVLGFSAWRLHYHTDRWGLISENGSFNQVFGRCHVTKIIALPDGPTRSRTVFGPPPLLQLGKRDVLAPGEWPQLDPVIDKYFYYYGYIGDADIHRDYMRQCVAQGGLLKQAEFALVHVLMLWRYNVLWPDSGKGNWAPTAARWGTIHAVGFALPAVLAALVVFAPRRHPKLALVAVHVWAAFIVAALYFGDVRLRTPYDPILVLLAFELFAILGAWAWAKRGGRNPGKSDRVEPVGSDPAR